MKSMVIKGVLISLALGAVVFALTGTASASHVLVDVAVPDEATVGDSVAVEATLLSAESGLPLANTPIVFYTEASFGGVTGEIELGRGVTDQNGVALLDYRPRTAGEQQIRVEYLTPGDTEPEAASTTTTITVASGPQLYQSTSGVQVPGLNVWLIIAVVAVVWSLLLSIGLRVMAIARASAETERRPERAPRSQEAQPQVTAVEAGRSRA